MDEEVINKYLRAGEVAYRIKKLVSNFVKPGTKLVEVAELIEGRIREYGAEPAFPLNISVNYIAAHRTPLADDEEVIPDDSVVKVDIGVHVDGYIADTAVTLVFNDKYLRMADVNQEALWRGLRKVKPGVRFSDVGAVINNYVRRHGFKVIKNLTGHGLGRYLIHAGEVIPNYRDPLTFGRFRSGRAYAVEPFVTDGKGLVTEVRGSIQIYALRREDVVAHDLGGLGGSVLKIVKERFKTLPFCERWLIKYLGRDVSINELRNVLNELSMRGYLISYPVLIEVGRGFVSQFEETLLVLRDGILITTNPEIKQ